MKKIKKFERSAQEHEQHLFDLLPAKGKVKESPWKPFDETVIYKEHRHKYRNVSERGNVQEYCSRGNPGQHIHKIEIEWDGDTVKSMKCGPPLVWKYTKRRNKHGGKRKALLPPRWVINEDAETGKPNEWIEDTHTHDLHYMGSELVSPNRKQKIQQDNAAKVSSMTNFAKDNQAQAMNAVKQGTYSNQQQGLANVAAPAGGEGADAST